MKLTISNFFACFLKADSSLSCSKTFIDFKQDLSLQCPSQQICYNYPAKNISALFENIINPGRIKLYFDDIAKHIVFIYQTAYGIGTKFFDISNPLLSTLTLTNTQSFNITGLVKSFYSLHDGSIIVEAIDKFYKF